VKGVELPINILVVVAIAVIVLLGLVALYFIGFNPFSVSAGIESIKNDACRRYINQYDNVSYVSTPCRNWAEVNVSYQGNIITFQQFMTMADTYACANENCARQRCTCPGY